MLVCVWWWGGGEASWFDEKQSDDTNLGSTFLYFSLYKRVVHAGEEAVERERVVSDPMRALKDSETRRGCWGYFESL